MSDDCKPVSDKPADGPDVSRRDFLNRACGGAAVICGGIASIALPSEARAQNWERSANVWKSRAGYQNYSRGPARCAGCLHFRPPSECAIVEPSINPNGWCRYFSPVPVVYAPEYPQPYYSQPYPAPNYPRPYYPQPYYGRPPGYY
jgi:hypothetical protein